MRRLPYAAGLFAVAALSGTAEAARIDLYTDAAAALPEDQGWLGYLTTNGAVPALVAGGTRLNTASGGTDPADEAGWFNKLPLPFGTYAPVNSAFPSLDAAEGFSLSFELQVHEEVHSSDDRAGFSVILLGADTRGVEIGFWQDQVWAQGDDPLFQHAESQWLDTTASETLFELGIQGSRYWLRGSGGILLSGDTRDYGGYISGFSPDPYEIPSFVFLGDNTDSAYADFTLGDVILRTGLPVPGPLTWLLAALPLMRRAGRAG